MAPVLGYWNIRGLACPIRLLLEQAGAEYEEKLYGCGPPPSFDRAEWLKDKFELGLDFPNLPYYIDGDVKLTQSHVILRYLARKHNMAGNNEAEMRRVDLAANQVFDYHMDYVKVVYNPEYAKMKEEYLKNLPDKLKLLTKFLGQNKFVAGDHVTYADFVLFEFLECQHLLSPTVLNDFPALQQFHQNVSKLPAVEKYFNSPKAIKYPFNGAPAFIGGQYSEQLQKKD